MIFEEVSILDPTPLDDVIESLADKYIKEGSFKILQNLDKFVGIRNVMNLMRGVTGLIYTPYKSYQSN